MADTEEIGKEVVYGALSSSRVPHLNLISYHAMCRVAARCDIGVQRKGDKAWNALTPNQEAVGSIDFAIERINHVLNHAFALRDKLAAFKHMGKFEIGDDDAAAIMWNGMYLCEATNLFSKASK